MVINHISRNHVETLKTLLGFSRYYIHRININVLSNNRVEIFSYCLNEYGTIYDNEDRTVHSMCELPNWIALFILKYGCCHIWTDDGAVCK